MRFSESAIQPIWESCGDGAMRRLPWGLGVPWRGPEGWGPVGWGLEILCYGVVSCEVGSRGVYVMDWG